MSRGGGGVREEIGGYGKVGRVDLSPPWFRRPYVGCLGQAPRQARDFRGRWTVSQVEAAAPPMTCLPHLARGRDCVRAFVSDTTAE